MPMIENKDCVPLVHIVLLLVWLKAKSDTVGAGKEISEVQE